MIVCAENTRAFGSSQISTRLFQEFAKLRVLRAVSVAAVRFFFPFYFSLFFVVNVYAFVLVLLMLVVLLVAVLCPLRIKFDVVTSRLLILLLDRYRDSAL